MPPVVPGADEERDRGDRVLSTAGPSALSGLGPDLGCMIC